MSIRGQITNQVEERCSTDNTSNSNGYESTGDDSRIRLSVRPTRYGPKGCQGSDIEAHLKVLR